VEQPRSASALPTRRSLRESEGNGQAARLATPSAPVSVVLDNPAPEQRAPMTRAQLRELERARAAQQAPVIAQSALSPADEPSTDTADVLKDVQAVIAQVEERIARAGQHEPDEVMPLVLRPGKVEPVDTLAPSCPVHDIYPVEPLNVIPGTSVVMEDNGPVGLGVFANANGEDIAVENGSLAESEFGAIVGVSLSNIAPVELSHESRSIHGPRVSSSNKKAWAPRLAVLGSIGLATVAVPVLANGSDTSAPTVSAEASPEVAEQGPSTVELVGQQAKAGALPSAIAQSISEKERTYLTASRTEEREVLQGCDGSKVVTGANGRLNTSQLCTVIDNERLQPEAAVAFTALNEAFTEHFGHSMCLVDGYRSLASQYDAKANRGALAAPPGMSNHGWGYAVDLCSDTYQSPAKWKWLHENAPTYGWDLPSWASRTYEPWHWEFTEGVKKNQNW